MDESLWKQARIGGLMRCCTGTLWEETTLTEPPKEGDTVDCNYCKSRMRFRDGAWEWDHD